MEPLGDELPPEALAEFEAVALLARAAALGPSEGSFPAAICAAINPPIAKVAMTASNATFAVRALVGCNGWRDLDRLRGAARTVRGDST